MRGSYDVWYTLHLSRDVHFLGLDATPCGVTPHPMACVQIWYDASTSYFRAGK